MLPVVVVATVAGIWVCNMWLLQTAIPNTLWLLQTTMPITLQQAYFHAQPTS